jgi:hypothetical protein
MTPYYYGGQQPFGAYRELDALVVPKMSQLANICAKCSNPQCTAHPRKSFSFTPQWVFLAFLVSPLIGAILSAVVRKSAAYNVPLCSGCDAAWRKANMTLLLSFLPGIAMFILGIVLLASDIDAGGGILGLGLMVGIFAPIIVQFAVRRGKTIWARKIDDRFAWLVGLHPAAIDATCQQSAMMMGQMGAPQPMAMMPPQPYVPPHLMR